MLKDYFVEGGGGVRLHAVETGNPDGTPILFVHGLSQCSLSWSRQLDSPLADEFRLVALDLRGHGRSEKPRDAYADSRLWADDINAVIESLTLDRPVICGWSYGPLVILDYLRFYGEAAVRGINFVGGVTRLGDNQALAVLGPEFLDLVPGFFSTDAEESVAALDSLLSLCFTSGLSAGDRYRMLGFSVSVPPHVRQALLSRTVDNADLLARLRTPVLVTHAAEDRVVLPSVIEKQMGDVGSLHVEMIDNVGHGCFWDDARTYNAHLADFVRARDG